MHGLHVYGVYLYTCIYLAVHHAEFPLSRVDVPIGKHLRPLAGKDPVFPRPGVSLPVGELEGT